jgi:hypothetical protein
MMSAIDRPDNQHSLSKGQQMEKLVPPIFWLFTLVCAEAMLLKVSLPALLNGYLDVRGTMITRQKHPIRFWFYVLGGFITMAAFAFGATVISFYDPSSANTS